MKPLSLPVSTDVVAESWEIRIDKEADIIAVRQLVRELTKAHNFDQFATAALATAASELSRNVWVHAKSGQASVRVLRSERVGLELAFVDQGPGIADLGLALAVVLAAPREPRGFGVFRM